MRWFRIFMVSALMMPPLLPASFAWAETEDDLDEQVDQVRREGQAVGREAGKIDQKTRELEIRRETLQEDLRVGDPFRSRRELRGELRANESRGQWYKHERFQNDFTTRRNQRTLQRLRRTRPHG